MRRIVQYVAEDGTPFDNPDKCAEYDRRKNFTDELVKFLTENFSTSTQDELMGMSKLWEFIYKDPEKFDSVLNAAKPKPKRGRPRKGESAKEEVTRKVRTNMEKIAPIKDLILSSAGKAPADLAREIKEYVGSSDYPKKRESVIKSKVPTTDKKPWRE